MSKRTRWLAIAAVLLFALILSLAIGRALDKRRLAAAPSSSLPPAQALELLERDLVRALPRELATTIAVSGGLQALDSALVKAKVAAELRTLDVREGDSVKAGQIIGHLDGTEYAWRLRQAEDQAAAAQAQLDIATRTLTNNRALVDQGFISRNALDTAVSNAAVARASLQAAQAAAELARKALRDTELRAPLTGLVAQRLAQPGERVGVDARIVEIVDLSRLELQAAIPAEEVTALRIGHTARLQIEGLSAPVGARVARISPVTQGGTRAVMAYLRLDATPGLRQGLFARGQVEVGHQRALTVPASVLRSDRSQPQLLSVEGGRVVTHTPTLGARGEADFGHGPEAAVQVLGGLNEGALLLRASVGNLPAGTLLRLPVAGAKPASAAAAAGAGEAQPAASAALRP